MDDIFKSVLVEAAGISVDHPLAVVLAGRSEVLRLTQESHDAVLKPEPPGGLSHAERATLACRRVQYGPNATYQWRIRPDQGPTIEL